MTVVQDMIVELMIKVINSFFWLLSLGTQNHRFDYHKQNDTSILNTEYDDIKEDRAMPLHIINNTELIQNCMLFLLSKIIHDY